MVNKIFCLILMFSLIITSICFSKETNIYKFNGNVLIINNKIEVNLNNAIEDVLKKLGKKYEIDYSPDFTVYILKDYHFNLYVNEEIKKIDSIMIDFYDEDKNDGSSFIDEIIFSDNTIKKDTSFNEIKKLFNNKRIKYSIEDFDSGYNIGVKNNQILAVIYMKDHLTGPLRVDIKVE